MAVQDALLIAQKLVTSLLMEDLSRQNMPHLVVKGKAGAKGRKDKDANTHLEWLGSFYDSTIDIEKLKEVTVVFDVVESYSVSYKGSLAQHTMLNGESIADNFTKDTTTFSISAKISTTSTLSTYSVRRTADILKEAFTLGLPVYLSLPDITSQKETNVGIVGLNPSDIYGVITSLDIARDSSIQDGFNISMSIAQPKFSKTLEKSGVIKVPKKTEKEIAKGKERVNPPKEWKGLCRQQLGKVLTKAGNNFDKSALMPPDEFGESLKSHVDGGNVTAKSCPVSDMQAFYKKVFDKVGVK